jgi:DNA-directed RNA polymerase specialized sigma subunit
MTTNEVLMQQEETTAPQTRTCSYEERDPITGEVTYTCGRTYPLNEQFFTKQARYAGGFKRWCRDCERRHAQRYYQRQAERARALAELRERLEHQLGREPGPDELARELPASHEEIERMFKLWQQQQERRALARAYEHLDGQGLTPTVEVLSRETGINSATVKRLYGAVAADFEIAKVAETVARLQQEKKGRAPDVGELAAALSVSRNEAQLLLEGVRKRAEIQAVRDLYQRSTDKLGREPEAVELSALLPKNSKLEHTELPRLLSEWQEEQAALRVGEAYSRLEGELGRPPRIGELAAKFPARVEDIEQLTKFAQYGAQWEKKNKTRRNQYRNERFKKHQQAARLEKLFTELTQLVSQRGYRCEARFANPEKQIMVFAAVRDGSGDAHTVRIILGESPALLPLSYPQLYQSIMQQMDKAERSLTEQNYQKGEQVFWVEQVGDKAALQPGEITAVNTEADEISYHVEGTRSNGIQYSVWVNSTEIEPRVPRH